MKTTVLTALLLFAFIITNAQNIDYLEYYFDSDPGIGSGIAIPITPGSSIDNFTTSIETSTLSSGNHELFIRSRDVNGLWSLPFNQPVSFNANPVNSNIEQLEYFFNVDPGNGNASSIIISPSNSINDLISSIDISSLTSGIHNLYFRSKNEDGIWSLSNKQSLLINKATILPDIENIEYFIDNDPGLGLANPVSISSGPNIDNLTFAIDVSNIAIGSHRVVLRSIDEEGKWSLINDQIFFKEAFSNNSTIEKIEYYFNSDPGLGQGQEISITSGQSIMDLLTNIDVSLLDDGIHTLYIRSQDEGSKWSHPNNTKIVKLSPNPDYPIVAVEYFINTDPGEGLGSQIPITPNNNIVNLGSNIPVASLNQGIYSLYVRSKNSNGEWSLTQKYIFSKLKTNTPRLITDFEYFIGLDPGFGNATPISISSSEDINHLISNLDISSLDFGIHQLQVRSKDEDGIWSLNHRFIIKKFSSDDPKSFEGGEYFIGLDPGFGNGITIPVSTGSNIGSSIVVDASNLEYGSHILHTRFKDENGAWSHNEIHRFNNIESGPIEMVAGEYFFDMDPGFGNGQTFVLDTLADINDEDIIVMPSGLSSGEHDLYFRTKDSRQRWSLTNVEVDIQVSPVLPINWLSFDIEKKDEKGILTWEVASAINTSHFEIQKQINAQYRSILQLPSENQIHKRQYQCLDEDLIDGWNIYRIKQVDLDEAFTYSPTRRIYHQDEFDIKIYPNPTPEILNISLNQSQTIHYTLINAQQQEVLSGSESEKDIQINFKDLIPGAYYLLIEYNSKSKTFLVVRS